MRPVLRTIHSPDVYDLAHWAPPPGPFAILVQLFVGDAAKGEESFDVVVCNPDWIIELATTDHVYDLRHHVVVDRYDFGSLRANFEKRVAAVEGANWAEIAEKLARLGHWEFEDYRPHAQVASGSRIQEAS